MFPFSETGAPQALGGGDGGGGSKNYSYREEKDRISTYHRFCKLTTEGVGGVNCETGQRLGQYFYAFPGL